VADGRKEAADRSVADGAGCKRRRGCASAKSERPIRNTSTACRILWQPKTKSKNFHLRKNKNCPNYRDHLNDHAQSLQVETGHRISAPRLLHLPGSLVTQASKDSPDNQVGIVRPFYRDRHNTRLFRRVIVPAWKQRIADVNHLFQ
jgi:hypothetical protein